MPPPPPPQILWQVSSYSPFLGDQGSLAPCNVYILSRGRRTSFWPLCRWLSRSFALVCQPHGSRDLGWGRRACARLT